MHNTNNETTNFSIEKMMEARERIKQLQAKTEMAEAGFNLSALGDQSSDGHIPEIVGGILYCSEEYLAHIKASVPEAKPDPATDNGAIDPMGWLGRSFMGLAIHTETAEEQKARRQMK